MPYYQTADGVLQYFASIAYAHELPDGAVIVPDDQALARLPTPMNIARQLQLQILDEACAADIVSGFQSNALGAMYHYPAKMTDQANLTASVLASLLPTNPPTWTTFFWCADKFNVWALRSHSAAQIQKVGADGKDRVAKCIYQKVLLEAKINAAQTPEDVAKVVWVSPV